MAGKIQKITLATVGSALAVIVSQVAAWAQDFEFTVKNNTRVTITQILVSEDGETWNYFDLGSGIGAGKTDTLVWDNSTNNQACQQWIKAVYADGSESEPGAFNFCEETDLVFSP